MGHWCHWSFGEKSPCLKKRSPNHFSYFGLRMLRSTEPLGEGLVPEVSAHFVHSKPKKSITVPCSIYADLSEDCWNFRQALLSLLYIFIYYYHSTYAVSDISLQVLAGPSALSVKPRHTNQRRWTGVAMHHGSWSLLSRGTRPNSA